jgi:L-arabinose isomerase
VRTFLRRWSMEGPTHHFALGIGHHAAELKKLGKALGIETVVVTENNAHLLRQQSEKGISK